MSCAMLIFLGLHSASASPAAAWPWMADPFMPPAQRAALLLNAMNLSEKVLLMHGRHSEDKDYGWYVGRVEGNPRLGIPVLNMNDGPQGFRDMNGSHKGSTTAYPSGLGVAATWDTDMAELWGKSMGEEFAGKGSNVQLGPGLCVARIPRNGRNFEYMSGEDPFLGYTLVQLAVKGIQSQNVVANAKHWVNNNQETNRTTDISVVDERTRNEIYYPPFEGAIEAGVGSVMCSYNKIQASPTSPAKWSCENPETLARDLKTRLGFKGWVMSDWGATHSASINAGLDQEMPAGGSMNHAPTDGGECNNLCALIKNGTVTEATINTTALRILTPMFEIGLFDHDVTKTATTMNNVTSDAHTAAARKIAAAGMVLLKNSKSKFKTTSASTSASTSAGAGADTDTLLPLADSVRSVAVIGVQGVDPYVHGGGSGAVFPARVLSPIRALRDRLGIRTPTGPIRPGWETKVGRGGCDGTHSLGSAHGIGSAAEANAACGAREGCVFWVLSLDPKDGNGTTYFCSSDGYGGVANADKFPHWLVGHKVLAPPPPPNCTNSRCVYYDDGSDAGRAADLAASVDVAIVFGATDSGEGSDRASLAVNDVAPGVSLDALVRVVAADGKGAGKVVVSIVAPGAVLMPWRDIEGVRAALVSFMPGQEYGGALADVLWGDTAPSGRLPLTLPAAENDMGITQDMWPGVGGLVSHYTEKLLVGYRYYDAKAVEPAFPFGHGLSYTSFAYADLEATATEVSFSLTNTGSRAGAEVPQLYLGFPPAAGEPPKQLKGFKRVQLEAGAKTKVVFPLNPRAKSIYDVTSHAWKVQGGEFKVFVGASSRDVRLTGSFS